MRKLKRFVLSAIAAGAAVGSVSPFAATVSVMAEDAPVVLTIRDSAGGHVESSAEGFVAPGELLDLKAVPDEGYQFVRWELVNDGYHEVVKGDIYQSDISVRVVESAHNLFSVQAVFVRNDESVHRIINGGNSGSKDYAEAGEVVNAGEVVRSALAKDGEDNTTVYFELVRVSDGKDITDDIYDKNSNTFIMPDYDIEMSIEMVRTDMVYDGVEFMSDVFHIESENDDVSRSVYYDKSDAHEGEKVSLSHADDSNNKYSGGWRFDSYKLTRKDTGEDVTEELLDVDPDSFYMPGYDLIVEGVWSYEEPEQFGFDTGKMMDIIVNESKGGSIVSNLSGVSSRDDTLQLSAVPDQGYRFVRWIFDDEDGYGSFIGTMVEEGVYEPLDETAPVLTFELNNYPESRNELKVYAIFAKETEKNSAVEHTIEGGLCRDAAGNTITSASEGEEVYLKSGDSSESVSRTYDYAIIRLDTKEDVTEELLGYYKYSNVAYSFSMPAYDIMVYVASAASSTKVAEFWIENASSDVYEVTDEAGNGIDYARPGEIIQVSLKDTARDTSGDNVRLIVERINPDNTEQGFDVTSELLSGGDGYSFVMPDYAVRIKAIESKGDQIVYDNIEWIDGSNDESNSVITEAEEINGNNNAPGAKSEAVEKSEAMLSAGGDESSEASENVKASSKAVEKTVTQESAINHVTEIKNNAAPVSAGAVRVSTDRYGSSSATAVKAAPATGNSGNTVVWIAAAAGASVIAGAAYYMKRKKNSEN